MKLSSRVTELLKKEIDPAFAQRAEFIFSQIEKDKPAKILDVGCGRGFYLQTLAGYSFVKTLIGIEAKDEYLKKARSFLSNKKIKVQKGNVYKLPFANNSFDYVILSEVLEHLENENLALQEIYRVLKKGGGLLVSVPHHDFPFLWDPLNFFLMKVFKTHVRADWWTIAGIWADHQRLYTKQQLRNVLKANNFKLVKLEQNIFWCWPFTHFLLYGIGKNIVEKMPGLAVNRFQTSKPSKLANLLAGLMRWPNSLVKKTNTKNGVGLVVLVKK
jgi:ubiquinone/menaquinone biosynthesis C-methylase UbiE